ncbi:MAG TPA: extensin family protein [Aestuariivirga sp.]|nr:extensin family protein [Aestuariivirga sp.]
MPPQAKQVEKIKPTPTVSEKTSLITASPDETAKTLAPAPDTRAKTTKVVVPLTTKVVVPVTTKVVVPVPRAKPATVKKASATVQAPSVKTSPVVIVPEKKVAILVPPQKNVTVVLPTVPRLAPDNGCLANLRNSGAEFESLATPISSGSCHVDVPIRLHAVSTKAGKITFPDAPTLNCQFARQFVLWLSDTGAAVVATQLDVKLAKVSTGPGYECRGRNGDASAKMSEHGLGNAVDITTLTTADGRQIQISDASNPAAASFQALRALRTAACGYFKTVLGPGSNAAHASHFHVDMGMHGKSGNYRICE